MIYEIPLPLPEFEARPSSPYSHVMYELSYDEMPETRN